MFSLQVRIALLALLTFTAGCNAPAAAESGGPPRPAIPKGVRLGGTLRVAFGESLATIDIHKTTIVLPRVIASHVWEGLFAYGEGNVPRPFLVKEYTVSKDRLVWEFTLRTGVLFHNGKEMTSEDVIATLKRWGSLGATGKRTFSFVKNIDATGRHSVRLELTAPFGDLLDVLSTTRQGPLIYPREVVERIGTKGTLSPTRGDVIGTGPFRFVEYIPDRHLKLARFKDYSARQDPPDGSAGRREAYIDELVFVTIPDPATRLPSLQAGEVHYAHDIPIVEFDKATRDPKVEALRGEPNYLVAVLNVGEGLLANQPLLRQAMAAAIDVTAIMRASVVDERFFRLDPGIMWKETGYWCDTGSNQYNQASPAKARRLLAEAGYDGKPIRWIVAREIPYLYDASFVAADQLKKVGFNISLQVLDWATISKLRFKPESWEVFMNWSTYRTDPALQSWVMADWANQWGKASPKAVELLRRLSSEEDHKVRRDIWCKLQELAYADVPGIKFGDYFPLNGIRKEVKGFRNLPDPFFWNVWLEQP